MLNQGNLEYLGVNILEQGTNKGPNFFVYSFLLFVGAFILLNIMMYIFFKQKDKLKQLEGNALPKDNEVYLKRKAEAFKVEIITTLLATFCVLFVIGAMAVVPIWEMNYNYDQSKNLVELRKNEYIVELTENTDLEKLTEVYSVYMIEDSVIARIGHCKDRFVFKSRSDNTIPYEILNKVGIE